MTSALIARADDGGLGSQTWDIARHVAFDRILIVPVDPPRGRFRPERFDGLAGEVRTARTGRNTLGRKDMDWLCACDRVVSVENFYNDAIVDFARAARTRLAVIANPELFPRGSLRAWNDGGHLDVYAPTGWETARLGNHRMLPQPVDTTLIPGRRRTGPAKSFLHVSAPAFLDRNGSALLGEALHRYVGPPITVYTTTHDPSPDAAWTRAASKVGQVTIVPLPDVDDYWTRWQPDRAIDAVIIPRRYGGLSLSMQEGLAAGLPVICLDRYPENTWPGTIRVPTCGGAPARMKGGTISRSDADPVRLADAIARLAMGDRTEVSTAALHYAEQIAWHTLGPAWTAAFAPSTSSSTPSRPTG